MNGQMNVEEVGVVLKVVVELGEEVEELGALSMTGAVEEVQEVCY